MKKEKQADSVKAILVERSKTHGPFISHAIVAQELKDVLRMEVRGWEHLHPDMRQALDVIMDKTARIMTGDPFYLDHWDDICGYSKLVADRLRKESRDAKA